MKQKMMKKKAVQNGIFKKRWMGFFNSIKLAKSNPGKVGLMILFDAMFLLSFFGLQTLFGYFAQFIVIPKNLAVMVMYIILSLIYFLIVLLIYSFFKYGMLGFVRSLFAKTSFSFNRLGQFYALNIIIAGIFFTIMIMLNFILASTKQSYAPYIFIFFAIPYMLFLYITLNTSQALFYEGFSIKESVKKSFSIAFTKIKVYREIILAIILFSLVLGILFLISDYLFQHFLYGFYLLKFKYFKLLYVALFDAILYLTILINRISFYTMAMEVK